MNSTTDRSAPTFATWSNDFKDARRKVGKYDQVIQLWKRRIPGDWKRSSWPFTNSGYRKKSKDGELRGEQITEKVLLDQRDLKLVRDSRNSSGTRRQQGEFDVKMLFHNVPSAKLRKGQVLADALGIVHVGKTWHPLLVEVKRTDNNPWFALVECLQQIRLTRANERNLSKLFHEPVSPRGAWGIVIAPANFFDDHMPECREMLLRLKKETRARIAFASCDNLSQSQTLHLLDSNWS